MEQNRELAVRVTDVSKKYRLGQIGTGTLYRDLQSWAAKIRGKEDPNQKLGKSPRLKGEEFMALNGVSLDIHKGEAVGIIGPNGAGKSTLLKLLCQITGPSKGEIELFGRVTSMLEVGTGFHSEMTGRENIYLNGAILGMTRAEIDAKMEDIIEFSEVREFIDTPVKRYSSGMYVKLAFSVAAHLDSEIMIMDEVLAVGDMAFQNKCLQKMKDAAEKEGRTVLYVSHNMNTIRRLCSRCIVLGEGKVVYDGDVESAIGYYLQGGNVGELPTYYNLRDIPRVNENFGTRVKLTDVNLLGRDQAEYDMGESMECEFTLDSEIDIKDVTLVMRVRNRTNEEKYGSSISKAFDLTKGRGQHIKVSMSLAGLMEDTYSFSFQLISRSDTGSYYTYDSVLSSVAVRIVNKTKTDLYWPTNYWGNIKLGDTDVD